MSSRSCRPQLNPVAIRAGRTEAQAAGVPVVDPIAVAKVEAARGAKAPDGVLDEAREGGGESGVELARVDLFGKGAQDVCTPTRGVASRPVGMFGAAAVQGAGPM